MASPVILVLLILLAIPLGIVGLVYLVVPACKGLAWLTRHLLSFVGREVGDVLRLVGGIVTTVVLVPLTLFNLVLGRWSSTSHFGRAIQAELRALGGCVYRIVLGNPARLFCLSALTEGLENRIPHVVAAAPGSERISRRAGQFEGYTITGSLATGGSGSKLYVAKPTAEKLAALSKAGCGDVDQVVIKSFSLRDGSSLPQIVRENRALPAAKRMGLILEHDLTEERFFYVMRYVPGESLGLVTQRLHAESGADGLADRQLRETIDYAADLVRTLCHYHGGGLWHKDVKPDNIIVASGQAHLVDFGLITPLRSSMTLTTHGTEYFRDPEMVRLALRGVKVHEVDGAKFDIYAAGAVLYSMIENSFPAHGGLSQISRRCPEALRWIVRRAMTDYDKRYDSAGAMLADLEVVVQAVNPFALKPVDLPSFSGQPLPEPAVQHEWEAALPRGRAPAFANVAAGVLPAAALGGAAFGHAAGAVAGAATPRMRLTNWWTGRYEIEPDGPAGVVHRGAVVPAAAARGPRVPGATAAEQLSRARERGRQARERAHKRMKRYSPDAFRPLNLGVGIAVLALMTIVGLVIFAVSSAQRSVGRVAAGDPVRVDIGDMKLSMDSSGRITVGAADQVEQEDGVACEDVDFAVEARRQYELINGQLIPPPIPPVPPVSAYAPMHVSRVGASAAAGELGEVMVLRDPVTFDTTMTGKVDQQVAALRRAGFQLRGNPTPADAEHPLNQAEDELVADLKNDLGIQSFGSADARRAALGWLERNNRIDMLIWFSQSDQTDQQGQVKRVPSTWIVAREGLSEGVVSAAAASCELRSAKTSR